MYNKNINKKWLIKLIYLKNKFYKKNWKHKNIVRNIAKL